MGSAPTPDWMERYRARVNADREMQVIGEWFSLDFKLSFGNRTYLLSVREGRIEEIVDRPRFDRPSRFTISAPMQIWTRFIRPRPEPLYHDFFAMLMRVPEFEIDGDSLAAMQNARALHRMMNILKTMEPLDG